MQLSNVQHARAGVIILITMIILFIDDAQFFVDTLYQFLLSRSWYNSAYFETLWVTLCYATIMSIPFTMSYISYFNKYKMDTSLQWHEAGTFVVLLEVVEYCSPLLVLDSIIPKRYDDVDPMEFQKHGKSSWIQITRALPQQAPPLSTMCTHLLGAFIIFDALFYVIHRVFHENSWLYSNIHKVHHNHDTVHTRVTNQLHFIERALLLLCANIGLRVVHAHPFTRTIFVPIFIMWLIDNHTGYQLPISIDKLVPFGLVAGPSAHFAHHKQGCKNYQPFFTYIDKIVAYCQS